MESAMNYRKVLYVALFFFICFVQLANGQNARTVKGSVSDAKGETIIGASVIIGKTGTGTVTDVDGNFSLQVKADARQLKISYIGYITQMVDISDKDSVNVVLNEDSKVLDEVVVTALGISREAKSLPYARQSVDTKGIDETRDANLLNMLSGKVSGVQFTSNGGSLSSTRVVIRGENSLTGNNQPLYVIDGIPIVNNMGDNGDLDYGNAASAINPDDIESIEVLKGANASALYGSDASNGVILITTKKAQKKDGLGISYSGNVQFSKLREFPMYQNVYGSGVNGFQNGWNFEGQSHFDPEVPYFMPNLDTEYYSQSSFGLPMLGYEVIGRNGKKKQYLPTPATITDMYKVGTQITNSISFDKVMDGLSVRFSYTNVHSDDIVDNFNKLKRNTFNLTATARLAKFLSVDVNANYVNDKVDNRGYRSSSDRNPLYAIANLPRDASVSELRDYKNEDGTPKVERGFNNPFWLMNELSNADQKHWFMGNVTMNFTITDELALRLRAATDVQSMKAWDFTNFASPFDVDGQYSSYQSQSTNHNFDALLSFNKKFGKFSINANAGTSYQKQESKMIKSEIAALVQPDMKSLANNAGTAKTWEDYNAKHKMGAYGQATLGFNNYLFLDATARNDWSSALPDPYSYFYYSGGASLVLTDLFKIPQKILSFAKLRASYAKTGNDTGFDKLRDGYVYGGLYKGNMAWYTGENVSRNDKLKPETTISKEFGADLRFLDNRLSLDFTYYEKTTKDQIVEASLSYFSGYEKKMYNRGKIRNRGYELSINAVPVQTKDFEWSIQGNWSKNESEVVSLMDGVDRFRLANWNGTSLEVFAEVGKPYGAMYGVDYRRDGDGNVICDASGRPLSSSENQYFGKVSPDWIGGISNTLRYKDFDLSFLIDFRKGGLIWSYSSYQGNRNGEIVESLAGRDDFFISNLILGENDRERQGYLEGQSTSDQKDYTHPYIWTDRTKGCVLPEKRVYGSVEEGVPAELAGKECNAYTSPTDYYGNDVMKSLRRYLYDTSFVKLRSISVGYNVPSNFLKKTPLTSARISAVGRNLWTIFSNTPQGLDPEATTSTGNGQGIESGFSLPEANYGFDIKVTF